MLRLRRYERNGSKIGDLQGQYPTNIHGKGPPPPIIFALIDRPIP